MRRLFISFVLSLLGFGVWAQVGDLPRTSAEEQGVSSRAITAFLDSLQAIPETTIHHVMVVRHGSVIAEMHPTPFRDCDMHTLYSESKTFIALAVGIAYDENRLRLDDRVATFFPEALPSVISEALAQITVRDLLTMNSGITPDWNMRNITDDWIRAWLAKKVDHTPGTYFGYDSMCTFMLSAIVQRVTGMTVLQYLDNRLFQPMHITEAEWELSPDGICTGGWGLRLQAESQAKIGVLILNKGMWEGQRLVSERWIEQMCAKQVECAESTTPATDGNQGYGFQTWRSKWNGSIRADGAFGQYIVMLPHEDLVVVINGTALGKHGHDELACIWRVLMPGVSDKTSLAADAKAQEQLRRTAAGATLKLPKGKKSSKKMKNSVTFAAEENASGIAQVTFDPSGTLTLTLTDGSTQTIRAAYGDWVYQENAFTPPYSIAARDRFKGLEKPFTTAAAYAFTTPKTITVRIYYVDWITCRDIMLNLDTRKAVITHDIVAAK